MCAHHLFRNGTKGRDTGGSALGAPQRDFTCICIMYKSIDFELYCLSQIARFFSGKAPRLVAMKVYDESEEVLQYLA